MKNYHTPGPWASKFWPTKRGTEILRITGPNGEPIADVLQTHTAIEDDQSDDNRALIAAAPDMLAALENVMANPTNFSFELIRSAITKAKGQ